jgi:hypothetical protein
MRELGRRGGCANPKAKRPGAQRESLREFLRREVDPARVWAAIEAGLESGNDRDRLAASKLLLTELYEPAAEPASGRRRPRRRALANGSCIAWMRFRGGGSWPARRVRADPAGRREAVRGRGDVQHAQGRRVGRQLGAPTRDRDRHRLATCGKEGVRLVAEGEPVSEGAVYCATCRPEEEGAAEASSLAPGTPPVAV